MRKEFILGIFTDQTQAEDAVEALKVLGYSPREISIVVKDKVIATEVAHTTGTNVATGALEGATTGGVVGGVVGLLVGIGAIALPGFGAILIGGPIAVALGATGAAATAVSAAATGALAGGLIGALIGLGLPEETARFYDEQLREGALLLAVSPNDRVDATEIKKVFTDHNAQDIQHLK